MLIGQASEERSARFVERIAAQPALLDGILDLERPQRSDQDGFRSAGPRGSASSSDAQRFEPLQQLWADEQVADIARTLIYDGREFIGWLGAVRYDSAPRFSRRQRERLGRLLPALRRAFIAAHALERKALPQGSTYVLMNTDGTVAQGSVGVEGWLELPGLLEELRAAVAALEAGEATPETRMLKVSQAQLIRLADVSSSRYLAVLSMASPILLAPDVSLSAAQRQVAEQAARGNTVDEIAKLVGRTPQTVRSYLREAYRRLGVSNRVGLARSLGING